MRQILSLITLSLLTACSAPQGAAPTRAPSPEPSPAASVSSAANAPSYELYTWLDPQEASKRCSFAIVAASSADHSQLAERVRAEAVVGLAGLEARLKALPEGSRLFWSNKLSFMSSLQFLMPTSARIEQVRRIAAERRLSLSFDSTLRADDFDAAPVCVD